MFMKKKLKKVKTAGMTPMKRQIAHCTTIITKLKKKKKKKKKKQESTKYQNFITIKTTVLMRTAYYWKTKKEKVKTIKQKTNH